MFALQSTLSNKGISPSTRRSAVAGSSLNVAPAAPKVLAVSRTIKASPVVCEAQISQASNSAQADTATQYYAVVANSEFMLNDVQNEPFPEQLREKVRFLEEKGMERDFWLVVEPAWLEAKFPNEAKKVGRPCVALVSTNRLWITFMKVRLDRVLKFDLGSISKEEALKSNGKLKPFTPPERWTAPYGRYAYGWWEPFFPGNESMKV